MHVLWLTSLACLAYLKRSKRVCCKLEKRPSKIWFETWSDLNLVTIIGRETNCVSGAPNDPDQIIRDKNGSRNACLLASMARRSTYVSKTTKNSPGPSSHSTNNQSNHTFSQPNDLPESTRSSPENNMLLYREKNMLVIVPLREHLATSSLLL
jgi:hypothetical protein